MLGQILSAMREAALARRVYLTEHARDEMADDGLSFQDVMMGEIVEDQYDVDRDENKYVIFGDGCHEDEMAVVAKLTYNHDAVVITVYRLRITDYE